MKFKIKTGSDKFSSQILVRLEKACKKIVDNVVGSPDIFSGDEISYEISDIYIDDYTILGKIEIVYEDFWRDKFALLWSESFNYEIRSTDMEYIDIFPQLKAFNVALEKIVTYKKSRFDEIDADEENGKLEDQIWKDVDMMLDKCINQFSSAA